MGEKGHRFGTETLRTGAEELTHEAQVLTHGVMTAPFRLRTYRLIRKILIGGRCGAGTGLSSRRA